MGFENLFLFLIVGHCVSKLKNLFHNLRTSTFGNFEPFNCLKSDILMVNRDRTIFFEKFFKIRFFIAAPNAETLLMFFNYSKIDCNTYKLREKLNCDLEKALVRLRFLDDVIHGANLPSAFKNLDAFW